MRKISKTVLTIVLLAVLVSTFATGCGKTAATATPVPPTKVPATPVPPTATKVPPTNTAVPPTKVPPTKAPTAVPPTDTAVPPTEVPTPEPTATPVPLASEEGVLTIWVNAERAPIMEAAGQAFTAQYNIPVRIQTMGFGDIRNNFLIAAPVDKGPDIIAGAHDWVGELYANGLLANVDLGDKAASFNPTGLKGFTYEGNLVGMPYQVEAVTMFYNKDLVPTPPTTWQELKDILTTLYADKKIDEGIAFVGGDWYGHYCIFTGFGGGWFGLNDVGDYDATKVILDSEGTIKGATEIDAMVKAGLLHQGVGYDQAKALFLGGKMPFWVNGPWELDNIAKSGLNYGLALIPTMEQTSRPLSGVQGFMVNKFSKNLLLAQAFLTEFVASDSVMMDLYTAQFGIPAWNPILTQIENPAIASFAAQIAVADPMPSFSFMSGAWTPVGNAITLLYQQSGTPEQIMKDAADATRALVK